MTQPKTKSSPKPKRRIAKATVLAAAGIPKGSRSGTDGNMGRGATPLKTGDQRRIFHLKGRGMVHPYEDPLLHNPEIRKYYEEFCRDYPVPPRLAHQIFAAACMKQELEKKRRNTRKSPAMLAQIEDMTIGLNSVLAGIERMTVHGVPELSISPLENPVSAAAKIAETSDRLAQFKAVAMARGSQVPLVSSVPRGQQVIDFIETLRVPDGPDAGKPLLLEEWQKRDIRKIYDGNAEDDELLMAVRQAVVTMGRKNGKTSIAAALVLVHLVGPMCGWNRQLYSAAFEREQAAIVFRAAYSMVAADEELSGLIKATPSSKELSVSMIHSTYHAISAESRSKHGMNPSFIIFDELGQFGADRELFDVLQTSMGAQTEALLLAISTQAANDQAILSQLIDYGRSEEGKGDSSFALIEYCVPQDADPWDEENWKLANPALGTFRSLKEMREFAKKAKAIPSAERTFRNLYLNQRVAEAGAFISPIVWDACGDPLPPIEELREMACFVGIDLSSRLDLTAVVLVFVDDESRFLARPLFYTPKDSLDERGKRDRVPYYDWCQQGFMEAVPGQAIDYRWVAQHVAQELEGFDIRGIVFDRWRFDSFKRELLDAGASYPDDFYLPFGQGFKDMSPAVDLLEEMLLNQRIVHGGHPVLRWNIGNAALERDAAGNRKMTKAKSYGRIDGAVALLMALMAASKYQDEGGNMDSFLSAPLMMVA